MDSKDSFLKKLRRRVMQSSESFSSFITKHDQVIELLCEQASSIRYLRK